MSNEYAIHLLRIAEEDFKEIIEYIAQDSPSAAERVAAKIELGLMDLSKYPLLGRAPKEPELAGAGNPFLTDRDNHSHSYPENYFVHTKLDSVFYKQLQAIRVYQRLQFQKNSETHYTNHS